MIQKEATPSDTADAIIIGAGVIGAATAFELAKLGYKTLSVDPDLMRYSTLDHRFRKATSTGASRRNILALRTSAGLRLF